MQLIPVLFPLGALYAAFQYRLLDTDRIITQSVLYSALLLLLMLSYWAVAAGATLFISKNLTETALNPVLIVLAIFVLAAFFTPIRVRLQRIIDTVYFRERRQYQRELETIHARHYQRDQPA